VGVSLLPEEGHVNVLKWLETLCHNI
jgi:hypothetical protein